MVVLLSQANDPACGIARWQVPPHGIPRQFRDVLFIHGEKGGDESPPPHVTPPAPYKTGENLGQLPLEPDTPCRRESGLQDVSPRPDVALVPIPGLILLYLHFHLLPKREPGGLAKVDCSHTTPIYISGIGFAPGPLGAGCRTDADKLRQ